MPSSHEIAHIIDNVVWHNGSIHEMHRLSMSQTLLLIRLVTKERGYQTIKRDTKQPCK